MSTKYSIAGYCRISVDEEMDRDNTSIENQKAIITDSVKRKFPDSTSPHVLAGIFAQDIGSL